ncbi:hypothetical protein K435DRAFT_860759 [Dendrothele bispora CBS 962.96]|uniref:Uncharacterized protein n=1 Tax=Dendrothele bispora (strain CBS 962.96) TaxID=1314807 RepID=A0A4S8LX32_DENBC|nr:hypothetical protein K435DRAFT_860759 [Dendrothele bispora CBS 962.96]
MESPSQTQARPQSIHPDNSDNSQSESPTQDVPSGTADNNQSLTSSDQIPITFNRVLLSILSVAFIIAKSVTAAENEQVATIHLDWVLGITSLVFGWLEFYQSVSTPGTAMHWWASEDRSLILFKIVKYSALVIWYLIFGTIMFSVGFFLPVVVNNLVAYDVFIDDWGKLDARFYDHESKMFSIIGTSVVTLIIVLLTYEFQVYWIDSSGFNTENHTPSTLFNFRAYFSRLKRFKRLPLHVIVGALLFLLGTVIFSLVTHNQQMHEIRHEHIAFFLGPQYDKDDFEGAAGCVEALQFFLLPPWLHSETVVRVLLKIAPKTKLDVDWNTENLEDPVCQKSVLGPRMYLN